MERDLILGSPRRSHPSPSNPTNPQPIDGESTRQAIASPVTISIACPLSETDSGVVDGIRLERDRIFCGGDRILTNWSRGHIYPLDAIVFLE